MPVTKKLIIFIKAKYELYNYKKNTPIYKSKFFKMYCLDFTRKNTLPNIKTVFENLTSYVTPNTPTYCVLRQFLRYFPPFLSTRYAVTLSGRACISWYMRLTAFGNSSTMHITGRNRVIVVRCSTGLPLELQIRRR